MFLTAILVVALLPLATTQAVAPGEAPFGVSPPDFWYSDNSELAHGSIECNNTDFEAPAQFRATVLQSGASVGL